MVNRLVKRGFEANKDAVPEKMVSIRNLTPADQFHGLHKIPGGGKWTQVPADLARRLKDDPNYEIAGAGYSVRIPPRRGESVLRHPAAMSAGRGDLDNPTVQRVWKDNVEKTDLREWPTVSIVIPVYNSAELLRDCLKSLLETDYPSGKRSVVTVDNASTEADLKEVLSSGRDSIRFDNPVGFAQAVNAGMKKHKADYYVLFNQDAEVIDPQWLKNIIRWMELRPQCGVAGAKLLYPDGTLQHCGLDLPAGSCGSHRSLHGDPDQPDVNYYERVQAVTGAVYCIRHTVFEALGGLDEGYKFGCEDTDFALRANLQLGMECWYVPDCTVRHIDNAVRKAKKNSYSDKQRIAEWCAVSDAKFRKDWGAYVDRCDTGSVSIVLPTNDATSGGCRVAWALANTFVNAGMETTVYTCDGSLIGDSDFPVLFQTKHINQLTKADILIATRFDTVELTAKLPANKRYYFVQQIETVMAKYCGATQEQVLASYQDENYEIITIGQHLADQLNAMGRGSTILDVGFYRSLYKTAGMQNKDSLPSVLFMASPADYKGANDIPEIVAEIWKLMPHARIGSFHRNVPKPAWSDEHFQPKNAHQVAYAFNQFCVYVCAPLSEGFAMTPIEAMACGTPVVMTDFPGKDQYARDGENCLIAPFRDAKAVASAVYAAMVPKVALKLKKGGLATAEKYDWANVGKQYVEKILGVSCR